MDPVFLSELASRKTAWLSARQAAVAANIANQNTPGYRAVDVAPFQDILAKTRLELAGTNSGHLEAGAASDVASSVDKQDGNDFEVAESGNSVGMEEEMAKGGEINRDYALTTNIVRSFHSMLMAALKA